MVQPQESPAQAKGALKTTNVREPSGPHVSDAPPTRFGTLATKNSQLGCDRCSGNSLHTKLFISLFGPAGSDPNETPFICAENNTLVRHVLAKRRLLNKETLRR